MLANITMPGVDGFEMASRIRKDKRYDEIKLIAVTGKTSPGTASKSYEAGYDGYLAKPAIKTDLLAIIQVVLGDGPKEERRGQILTRHTTEEIVAKPKVLVVDDNTVTQKLLSVMLGNIGCESEMASDGAAAVDMVRTRRYDLVLMDLQMPVMGGCEAARVIREEISRTLPIIALTAATFKEDREASRAAGMDDFITKPIELNKLREKIIQWTKKERT
jgi:CheY-like chemotaxis protein